MQKTLIAIVVVGLLIILGGGAYFFLNKSDTEKETTQTDSSNQTQTADANTIRDLLTKGKNVMCNFNSSNANGSTSGTVYISGDKMRGDFAIKGTDGDEFQGYMIRDGKYSYSWSSLTDQGTKLKQETKDTGSDKSKDSVDLDDEVDFKCSSWNVDNSKFTLPADVTFTDISESVQKIDETTNQIEDVKKSACDQIVDSTAKQTCLDAI